MTNPVKVLLVDDHRLFMDAMETLLSLNSEFQVVGKASDGYEAVEKAKGLKPDLILMDIRMPHLNGIEATRIIKEENPEVKIVVLTVSEEDKDLFEAIKNGAEGYVLKNLESADFFNLLRNVVSGEVAFSPGFALKVLRSFSNASTSSLNQETDALSTRELEVLENLSQGCSNREIASGLNISENTVRFHLRSILTKLHVRNRTAAATYALRQGIVKKPSH